MFLGRPRMLACLVIFSAHAGHRACAIMCLLCQKWRLPLNILLGRPSWHCDDLRDCWREKIELSFSRLEACGCGTHAGRSLTAVWGARVQGRSSVLPGLAARAAAAGHHGRGDAAQELPRAHRAAVGRLEQEPDDEGARELVCLWRRWRLRCLMACGVLRANTWYNQCSG